MGRTERLGARMSRTEILNVARIGTAVKIEFHSELPIDNNVFPFRFECGTEWAASLLASKLRQSLYEEIRAIRENEYQRGYRDGRAKRAKENWFSSSFGSRWVKP